MSPAKRKRVTQPGIADGTEEVLSTPKARRTQRQYSSTSKTKTTQSPSSATKRGYVEEDIKIEANRLIVGVDYGTTYSGVSYVMKGNCDARDVEIIGLWPAKSLTGGKLFKVPSRIALREENPNLPDDAWGYAVTSTMKSYAWTKLLLDVNAEHNDLDSRILAGQTVTGLLELPRGFTAQELVSRYLSKLYEYIMETLERAYSAKLSSVTKIDFWFTRPATWHESACDATRKAAESAGFLSRDGDRLHMITEPEAAAIAILCRGADLTAGTFQENTNVLVADLGGGTLDFQCLTIKTLKPHLKTEEAVIGQGAKSGGAYIDCNLHSWLEHIFGEAFKSIEQHKIASGSRFMNEWELLKISFDKNSTELQHRLHLPALGVQLKKYKLTSAHYDMDDLDIILSGTEIAEFFEPVLKNAFALIEQQLQALREEHKDPFKLIVLCGGLGQSLYVKYRCKQYCTAKFGSMCQLVDADNAWSAVVRGAAVRGLDGDVFLSKVSKKSYGIAVHQPFREGIDKEEDAVYCPVKGKRAGGYMDWFVKKNRRFVPRMKAESKVYLAIERGINGDDLKFDWESYSSTKIPPPLRLEEAGVRYCGTVKLDLSDHADSWDLSDTEDDAHDVIPIKVAMKLGSEQGVLVVEALHYKKVVGVAKIDYSETAQRNAATLATPGLL